MWKPRLLAWMARKMFTKQLFLLFEQKTKTKNGSFFLPIRQNPFSGFPLISALMQFHVHAIYRGLQLRVKNLQVLDGGWNALKVLVGLFPLASRAARQPIIRKVDRFQARPAGKVERSNLLELVLCERECFDRSFCRADVDDLRQLTIHHWPELKFQN